MIIREISRLERLRSEGYGYLVIPAHFSGQLNVRNRTNDKIKNERKVEPVPEISEYCSGLYYKVGNYLKREEPYEKKLEIGKKLNVKI